MVSLKSSPWPKYTKYGTIFEKNHALLSNFVFFFKYVLDCSFQIPEKKKKKKKENRGSQCLFRHKLPRKVDIVLRSRDLRGGDGDEEQKSANLFENCTRVQACIRLFLCV